MRFVNRTLTSVTRDRDPVDDDTLNQARILVQDVATGGLGALRDLGERFGDLVEGDPLFISREACDQALLRIPADDRVLLERTAERIRRFADAQRAALTDVTIDVPGGTAGHRVMPVASAGCYAPGGRFPLPSSVLMTAVTARAAGVERVILATPRPTDITLAAAAIAGVDRVLAVGGAQAIAALAYGVEGLDPVDVIVGPGNKWVTAAKQVVVGRARIDLLAGPSELVVLADDSASPEVIAADVLAQAEHDPDAVPLLITPSSTLADRVRTALATQLRQLSTRDTAIQALSNGGVVLVEDVDAGIAACEALAPEHLQVMTANSKTDAGRCTRYGGLFIGAGSAEVFGDYGVGPNHTLPTGGSARSTGGLSVFHFVAIRTWLDIAPTPQLVADTGRLADLEGLAGHAAAARCRG